MSCVFCGSPAGNPSLCHILPASLGGDNWACLPDGVECSRCNQYFGEKVEKPALQSFPFLSFRVLLGIPTRKKAKPEMKTHLGIVRSGKFPGLIELLPASQRIALSLESGNITHLTFPAEPSEPLAVARMLVKMGLEIVGSDSPVDARSTKFDSARIFARCPKRGSQWWFVVRTDHPRLFSRFTEGIEMDQWVNGVQLSVHKFEDFEAVRVQLLDMTIFAPLDSRVCPPDLSEFLEPEYRLFVAKN